jgi:S-DNA-T family DNA segregation ATPase FtsK/SpoIIIE
VLEVRSLRVDPLAQPYPLELAPAAPYALDPMAPRPWTWHLGRDEWGRERSVPLAQLPAWTCAGVPGYGKTCLATGLLYQFSPSPLVRVMLLADGKGGGDYLAWDGRAERITGEDLAETTDALAEVHAELVRRLAAVMPELGVRNAWRIGPSRSWPLGLTLLDEIHTFTDLDLYKGDRDAEKLVRHCRRFVSELVRKGRSVMMLTGCLDQHMTTDALPSGIRDAAPLALSFATKTTAKSVAALSEDIRQYPDLDPTQLQDEAYRGVLVAGIRTGLDPYCRIRVPEITEEAAAERAALTAPLRNAIAAPPPRALV